jgi:hypothetical protein
MEGTAAKVEKAAKAKVLFHTSKYRWCKQG